MLNFFLFLGMCDQNNGTCACKPQVAGRGCNICKVGTYGLNASNPDGCTRCNCSSRGTAGGNNTPQGLSEFNVAFKF